MMPRHLGGTNTGAGWYEFGSETRNPGEKNSAPVDSDRQSQLRVNDEPPVPWLDLLHQSEDNARLDIFERK